MEISDLQSIEILDDALEILGVGNLFVFFRRYNIWKKASDLTKTPLAYALLLNLN